MKTKKIKDYKLFYYKIDKTDIWHGLYNESNLYFGYCYQDKAKGFHLNCNKE